MRIQVPEYKSITYCITKAFIIIITEYNFFPERGWGL